MNKPKFTVNLIELLIHLLFLASFKKKIHSCNKVDNGSAVLYYNMKCRALGGFSRKDG